MLNSAWVAAEGDPQTPSPDPPLRHFVLLFRDSTFECLARGFRSRTDPRPMEEVLREEIVVAWTKV